MASFWKVISDPNQKIKLKRQLMFWKIFLKNKIQNKVQFKDSICLKLIQIGPYVLKPWTPHLKRP